MERQQVVWKERELVLGITVLFLFGVLAGFLLLKVMSMLVKGMELAVDEDYLQQLLAQKPNFDLYLYTTWKKLKGILLFLMLAMTWLNLPYMGWLTFKQGFLLGYLLTSILPKYHAKGILLVCSYYFPQVLFRIPLWSCCFLIAFRSYKRQKGNRVELGSDTNWRKFGMLHLDGKQAVLIMLLCFAESAAESWIGTTLLQKAIQTIL